MGFFLQLINVKIIIYGMTMFSAYILPYETKVPILFCFAVYLMFLGALGKSDLGLCRKCTETVLHRALQTNERNHGTSAGMVFPQDHRNSIIIVNTSRNVLVIHIPGSVL